MALKKRVELDSGVDVDYWRIVNITVNIPRGRALVELLAWRSAAARNSGKQPIHDSMRTVELQVTSAADFRLSALYQAIANEQREIEPARSYTEPGTGRTVTVPAVVEPGYFNGAEDV